MLAKFTLTDLVELLEAHRGKVVSEILPRIQELCSLPKGVGAPLRSSIRSTDNKVLAIKDSKDGRWKPVVGPEKVGFHMSSGLYHHCSRLAHNEHRKIVNAANYKERKLYRSIKEGDVMFNVELYIAKVQKEIEEIRSKPVITSEGFATKGECIAYLESNGFTLDVRVKEAQ